LGEAQGGGIKSKKGLTIHHGLTGGAHTVEKGGRPHITKKVCFSMMGRKREDGGRKGKRPFPYLVKREKKKEFSPCHEGKGKKRIGFGTVAQGGETNSFSGK